MLGAIVGDIVGSVYEFNNIKTKDFPLFRKDCFFTDDTVMTCAVAEAVMKGGKPDDFVDEMKRLGRLYPDAGYGGRFLGWLFSDDRAPYNSFGNGSAMRVSPCGWMMDCGFAARTGGFPHNGYALAERSAAVTHDHPEGIRGAGATAYAIFLARFYFGGWHRDYEDPIDDDPAECKKRIKENLESRFGYDLSRTLDEIRRPYVRTAIAKGLSPSRVLVRHVLRNSLVPVVTNVSLAVPFLFTGSILLESFYGIPGLGGIGLDAVYASDYATVRAVVLVSALLYQLANLLADLAYAWLDPQVRLS